MVICAVASKSPSKVKAVEEAFAALLPGEKVVVNAHPQPSGVSDMPMTEEETRRGCETRLEGLQKLDADFLVAFEGGLMGKETIEVFAYCAVSLGAKYWGTNKPYVSVTRTATFVLPPGLSDRIRSGTELGPATDEEFQAVGGCGEQGTVGMLTQGRITRMKYHAEALELALIPFRNAERYKLPQNPVVFKKSSDQGVANGKPVDPVADDGTFDEIKKLGNDAYMAKEFKRAVGLYSKAIKKLEAAHSDEPVEIELRKALAVLYTNRAMANLSLCKETLDGKTFDPNNIPKEVRPLAMKANADASTACELDPQNGKAYFRKGQAVLWLSALPQRAKEAIAAFEQALRLTLTPSIKQEAEQWLEYAKKRLDATTDMPDIDPTMCKQQ